MNSMKRTVHAACPHDCPDACGVLITIEDGRATQLEGDPAHPVTRGFLCAKVAKYLDRVYSPDRVLYPMRRKAGAAKGPCAAASLPDFRAHLLGRSARRNRRRLPPDHAQAGAESILPYSYGGTLGALNGASMDRRFFHRLGASQLDRTICSNAGEDGLEVGDRSTAGHRAGTVRAARTIIAWGSNIHGNNVHLWPFIEEARQKGAQLIVIDPYQARGRRKCADWHLPINPGTDVALALGMMHVIINEDLYDADYVSRYTVGFEELKERVQEYPPERSPRGRGSRRSDIRKLAREYATSGRR